VRWDEWRGSLDGRPVFYTKKLFTLFGVRVCLHKMVDADDPECFHTHPAKAVRVILWGGYRELICDQEAPFPSARLRFFKWRPLMFGLVKPNFCHRIYDLNNGKVSYSIWIRFKKTHDVKLVGDGWSDS